MNNRSAGPRSFNTLQRSNRSARLKRLQEARILLLTICALILVLALTGLVFLFCQIGHNVSTGGGGGNSGKVKYTSKQVNPWDEGADTNVYRGNLILVNEAHSYHYPETRIEDMTENEKNAYSLMTYRVMVGNTYPYYVLPNSKNFYMIPEAAKAMGDLLTYHYNQTEEQLLVRAGYQQESSVTNGNYDQQVGLSASIDNDMDVSLKSDTCQKLISEGVKFGIIQRFPNGKASETGASGCTNVFRYVGVPHAGYITSQGITLEAYLSRLQSDYTYSKSHLLLNAEGKVAKAKDAVYEVYYVEATADGTMSVPVPKNYRYTISGDNMKGFIVTVNLSKPIA